MLVILLVFLCRNNKDDDDDDDCRGLLVDCSVATILAVLEGEDAPPVVVVE